MAEGGAARPPLAVGVLISGRGSNLQALIDACANAGFPARIAVVISNVASAPGLERARRACIPAAVVDHRAFGDRADFEDAVSAVLSEHSVGLVCLAGFMRILSPRFLDAWPDRIVNIHPSLLPAFPGLDTHARVISAGCRFSGCTVHFVRAGVDDGPILAQAAVPVRPDDTADTLAARVLDAEHRLYPMVLRLIAEGRVRLKAGHVEIEGAAWPEQTLLSPRDVLA
jgi:phosphoribosylglycinamide formyltransferase-1